MTTTDVPTQALTALRPARLLDGSGAPPLAEPTVILSEGRILDVAPGRVELPEGTSIVDLPGCTLLPGLVDPHLHLAFDAGLDVVGSLAGRDDEAALEAMATAAGQALRAGITTVRDLGDRGFLALELRECGRAAGGETPWLPSILAAGPPLTTPGGHCHFLGGVVEGGAGGMRDAVARYAERGVDVIKLMASGGFLTPGSGTDRPQFGPEELRAAVDEAHGRGLPVTAHAHSTVAVAAALEAGVDGIEHCSFLTSDGVHAPDELIRRLARQGTVVGATIGALPGSEIPPAIASLLDDLMAMLARLYEAGVPVVAAPDGGVGPPKPHDVLPYAAYPLHAIGRSPAEIVRTLTSDAARACGVGGRTGRVSPGMDADLLAVRGDPLADLGALRAVEAVYLQGRPVVLPGPRTP